MLSDDTKRKIVNLVQAQIPELLALYLFGSQAQGVTTADSDVDLAVYLEKHLEAVTALALKGDLVFTLNKDVDIVDLQRADTVTQAQVIATGQVLFARDSAALGFFETQVYSKYAQLNEERSGIVQDIVKRGSVYG